MSHHLILAQAAAAKARGASAEACAAAIADCHATLKAGGYEAHHPYGQKLWAEIDAYRDRQMRIAKKDAAQLASDHYSGAVRYAR